MPISEDKIKAANNRLVTTDQPYWCASCAAGLIAVIVWPYLPAAQALTIFAILLVADRQLSFISARFWRDQGRDQRAGYWEKWLFAGNLIAGTIWGLVCAVLYLQLPESPQILVGMMLVLVIGGWSIAHAPSINCTYAFSIPATTSIVTATLIRGEMNDYVIGIVAPIFLMAVMRHMRVVAEAYRALLEISSTLEAQAEIETQRLKMISQEHARLHNLLEAIPVPISVVGREDGKILYMNHHALSEFRRDDLSSTAMEIPANLFADPADRDRLLEKIVNNEAISNIELRLKRGDGSEFWVLYSASDMLYENLPALIGAFPDITKQREAEEARRQSDEKFRLLADNANDFISIYSLDSVCLYASPSLEKLLGYRPEEFVGQPVRNFVHPDDIGIVLSSSVKSLKAGNQVSQFLFRIRHKSGDWEWLESTSSVEKNRRTGEPLHVSSVSRLVTDRIQHEQELKLAREGAEAANRAKSEFIAHMSHEIRTPLNAVIGFSEMMRDQMFGPLGSPRYVEYCNDIHNSGMHLLDLVNDILDLSKIEAGKLELQEDQVELQGIVDTAIRFMRERAHDKHIALEARLEATPELWCDRRIMIQVMLNVIGNAVKFTGEHGRISVESRLDAVGDLVLSVTDTGIGIAPEDIERVMQPFGQARKNINHASEEPGTGLGLPLSRSFVEKHGGSFAIASEPGIGTRITITLPASRVMQDEPDKTGVSAAH